MLEYFSYLVLIALGSLALAKTFGIEVAFKRLFSLWLIVVPLFFIWDFLAVERGHWSFNASKVVGVFLLNQPVEEALFFVAATVFYVVLWEVVKKWSTSSRR